MNIDIKTTLSNIWILLPMSVAVLSVSFSFLFPKKKELLPGGLLNLGNTCFANSILQALASCPALVEYLRNSDAEIDLIILELTERLNEISVAPIINPKMVLNALSMTSGRKGLLGYQQQDAHEFLIALTDQLSPNILQDDLIHLLNNDGQQGIFLGQKVNFAKLALKSPIKGYLAMRLCCQSCGYKTPINHESFDNLSLVVDKRHITDLTDLLLKSIATEVIQDWCCDRCKLLKTIQNIQEAIKNIKNDINNLKRKKMKASNEIPILQGTPKLKQEIASDVDDSLHKEYNQKLNQLRLQLTDLENDVVIVHNILDTDLELPLPSHLKKVTSGSPTLKRTLISRPPVILTIHMQRSIFDYTGNVYKNNCRVHFPEFLDIREFCTCTDGFYFKPMEMAEALNWKESLDQKIEDVMDIDRTSSNAASNQDQDAIVNDGSEKIAKDILQSEYIYLYKLNAVVLHYGSHDSGHFVTYRRFPKKHSTSKKKNPRSDRWYAISDDHVRRIWDVQSEVFGYATQFVYLLFYERIQGISQYDAQILKTNNEGSSSKPSHTDFST